MRNFFNSKSVFFAVLFLFTASFAWNISHGFGTAGGCRLASPAFAPDVRLAHGPTVPPDPWDVRLAHGPTVPPDPWDVRLAHGPTVPPDPWDVRLAHGPTVPPDPWDLRIAG